MSVICTLINSACVVHATDSQLTQFLPDGTMEVVEPESKLVRVPEFAGILSYCGQAAHEGWSARLFLQLRANEADEHEGAEEFARNLADRLNEDTDGMSWGGDEHFGILIHFTAYERFGEILVPELFLITNYVDPNYETTRDRVVCSRETFLQFPDRNVELSPTDRTARLFVGLQLHEGRWLMFNNGDPRMFNPMAGAILTAYLTLRHRDDLDENDPVRATRQLSRSAVDMVALAQERLCLPGRQLVGGESHVISVTADGTYESETND